jgi:hypothetical protein
MTVTDLLKKIRAYPGVTAEMLATFVPVFHARLKAHEGEKLEAAAIAVFAEFKPTTRQPFPIPKDFEQHLPSGKLDLGPDAGPTLDLKVHAERKRKLVWNWKASQGDRASNGRPEIMRALQYVAEQIADQRAWSSNPEPIALTRKQVFKAQQSALSIKRRELHGLPPKDAHLWWSQLEEIARGWGMEITPEWWSEETSKALARKEAA